MVEKKLWEVVVTWALTIYANLVFVVLWVGLVGALLSDREWLASFWDWVQALPPLFRMIIWIALLPIMVGLWIWESSWTPIWRIVGFAGIVAWSLVAVSNLPKIFLMKVKK